jgi:alpha-tubulin suppressor-like RCC1 family protein
VATLLSVLQDACDFGGFPRPTSIINNTDATTRQLLAIANERGIEAVRMFDWPQLTKLSSLSLVAGTNQTLPADCAELLDSTAWYTGDMTPIRGPITPREWQALTQTGNAGIKFAFRVTQSSKATRAVAMHPTPVGTETISLFYRSKTWIKPRDWAASMSVTAGMWVFSDGEYWTANTSGTAGSSAPTIANNGADGTITWTRKPNVLYERFVADTDEPLIEPSLLMKGILARFYRMKGLEYQDLEAEFNIGLRNDLAERNGGRTSNLFRHSCGFIDTGCRDVGFIGGASSTPTPPVPPVPPVPNNLLLMGTGLAAHFGTPSRPYFYFGDAQIFDLQSIQNEFAEVSCGDRYSLFLKTDNTLWASGLNEGRIGNGSFDTVDVVPAIQIQPGTTWKAVSAGYLYSLAIKTNGTLWGWGNNTFVWQTGFWSLGDGTQNSSASPIQIGTDTDWANVFAGSFGGMGLKTNGTLWSWGWNGHGQLGIGGTTNQLVPTQVGTDTDWAKVAFSGQHALAIKTDGTLWVWGKNNYAQLGDGGGSVRTVPFQLGTDTNWKDIVAGDEHSLALKTNGTLWGWGKNSTFYGGSPLGLGDNIDRSVPTQVGTATDWESIGKGMGVSTHHAKKTNGTLWGWGANSHFPIGDGTNTSINVPTLIQSYNLGNLPTGIIKIANGGLHTVILVTQGA